MYDKYIGNQAFLNELNSLAKGIEQSTKSGFKVLIIIGKALAKASLVLVEPPVLQKSVDFGKVEYVDGAPKEQQYSQSDHPPNNWNRF